MESKILKLVVKYGVEMEIKFKKDNIIALISNEDEIKVLQCGFIKNLINLIEVECKDMHNKKVKKDSIEKMRLNEMMKDIKLFPVDLLS